MQPPPLVFGNFSAVGSHKLVTAQIQGFSAAVRGGPAAYAAYRAGQRQQFEELKRQVDEFGKRFCQPAARPGMTRGQLRQLMQNAYAVTSTTAKPSGGLSLQQRIANAIAETPITARPPTGRKHFHDRVETATHEAGHLLAALAFNATIRSASVVPDGAGTLGNVAFSPEGLSPVQLAAIALCGPLASRRKWGGYPKSDADQAIVDRALSSIADRRERDAAHSDAIHLANDLITKNSRLLARIESALHDHERLSGDELNQLVAGQRLYH